MGNEATEKKLRFLFGFQRFMQDPELKEVIDDTESNKDNLVKLSDFDLFSVAAGTNSPPENKNEYCCCPLCQKNTWRRIYPSGEYYCEDCKKTYYDQ